MAIELALIKRTKQIKADFTNSNHRWQIHSITLTLQMGSDELYAVKSGKLKLKGEKKKKKKKEKKRKRDKQEVDDAKLRKKAEKSDIAQHGGWWAATQLKCVTGPVAIQLKGSFVKSVDDGTFTIGAPHGDGEGPDADEILLAIKVPQVYLSKKRALFINLLPIYPLSR